MLLVIASFKVEDVCGVVLSPVVLALSFACQTKVEGASAVKERLAATPLQTVVDEELVMVGGAVTATLSVCEVPTQPSVEVGVMV